MLVVCKTRPSAFLTSAMRREGVEGKERTGIKELLCLTDAVDPRLVAEHEAIHFDNVATSIRVIEGVVVGRKSIS